MKGTLVELTDLKNSDPLLASGFGIVVNLRGTGDGRATSHSGGSAATVPSRTRCDVDLLAYAGIALGVLGTSAWGGRTLARHYGDGQEVGATLAVALSAVVPMALLEYAPVARGVLLPVIAVALAIGLVAGYRRTD